MGQHGRLTKALSNHIQAWVYNGSQQPEGAGQRRSEVLCGSEGDGAVQAVKATSSSGFSKHNRKEFSSLRKKKKQPQNSVGFVLSCFAWIVCLLHCLLGKVLKNSSREIFNFAWIVICKFREVVNGCGRWGSTLKMCGLKTGTVVSFGK